MTVLSISDIAKKPSILDEVDDVVEIVNKKTNQLKGIFINSKDLSLIKDILKEIEYKKWLKRNKVGFETSQKEFDELFGDVIDEIGETIERIEKDADKTR